MLFYTSPHQSFSKEGRIKNKKDRVLSLLLFIDIPHRRTRIKDVLLYHFWLSRELIITTKVLLLLPPFFWLLLVEVKELVFASLFGISILETWMLPDIWTPMGHIKCTRRFKMFEENIYTVKGLERIFERNP